MTTRVQAIQNVVLSRNKKNIYNSLECKHATTMHICAYFDARTDSRACTRSLSAWDLSRIAVGEPRVAEGERTLPLNTLSLIFFDAGDRRPPGFPAFPGDCIVLPTVGPFRVIRMLRHALPAPIAAPMFVLLLHRENNVD